MFYSCVVVDLGKAPQWCMHPAEMHRQITLIRKKKGRTVPQRIFLSCIISWPIDDFSDLQLCFASCGDVTLLPANLDQSSRLNHGRDA
jgi:hypothetical protein